MAEKVLQEMPIEYVDIPELPETFADTLTGFAYDGMFRIELSVTRIGQQKAANDPIKRVPACRLVLTTEAARMLFQRLTETAKAVRTAQAEMASNAPPSVQ
jgi:hypothetical protein